MWKENTVIASGEGKKPYELRTALRPWSWWNFHCQPSCFQNTDAFLLTCCTFLTHSKKRTFSELCSYKKTTDFCDLLMFGKPTKQSGEKRKATSFTIMQSKPSETPATSPYSGLSAACLELSWTSAIDPKYSMSLWEHNLPSHALCLLCSKHYSWSGLGLDVIHRENNINISH